MAAGFHVKPGSGSADPNGIVGFSVDLGCADGRTHYFWIPDPSAAPLQLQTNIITRPAPTMIVWSTAPFATQPTQNEIRTNALCASPLPPEDAATDPETKYSNAGFQVVPNSYATHGAASGIDINLGCADDPRLFIFGTLWNSLIISVESSPDPNTTTRHTYEFTDQPTPQQVIDLDLCS